MRSDSSRRPGGSPWMVSSSPCSESSKVRRWRPGTPTFGVRRITHAILRWAHARFVTVGKTPRLRSPFGLQHYFDVRLALAREQADRDARVLAAEQEVEATGADAEAAHDQPVEEMRQPRLAQAHGFARRVDLQAQAGLNQGDRRARGPCLRRARDRVEGRGLAALALEAAEQLG